MRLLADENVEAPLVRWLQSQRHDVIWAAEQLRGRPDTVLVSAAREENRVLITGDLDFGELVYRQGMISSGIILLRLSAPSLEQLLTLFTSYWPQIEASAKGHFAVVANQKLRIRPLHR